jgi:glycosyltransferase involved in cell wall biosynthesis
LSPVCDETNIAHITSPRVVFLTDIVTPYMVAVLAALARRVELTALFCSRSGTRGAGWAFTEPLPFRHRVIGGLAIRRRSKGDGADVYLTPRILTALLSERPAVVISGAFSFPTAFGAVYARLAAGRLIIHSDGTAHSERDFGPLRRLARDRLLREASACVANSEPAAERFIELGAHPSRVFRAPHSTNIAPFHAVGRLRLASSTSSPPLTVLHVGRLIPRKGVDRLLLALAALPTDVRLRLLLVGSGPEQARLSRLAHELGVARQVEFRGFVDQPGLPAVYASADIFAMPTLEDPFGMVLLEAAAAGLPLVASPFAGASVDLVEDGRSGFLADPHDITAWSRALSTLARSPELRRRLGARAHELTLSRTPERAADGYLAAVDAALSLPRGIKRPSSLPADRAVADHDVL